MIELPSEVCSVGSARLGRDQLDELRRKLWRRLGELPQRCDLCVEKVDEVDLDDLVREELRYQLEPDEWVTGFILRPKRVNQPLPGIVALHGHGGYYQAGKMEVVDQYPPDGYRHYFAGWGMELARRGYVVICQDQLCFEDRSWIRTHGDSAGARHEQFEMFSRFSQGRTMMGKLGFDTSRAVDVLAGRADVDDEFIGAMGHSGGGAQAYTACLFDPRVRAAVVNCGITSVASKIRDSRTISAMSMIPGMALLGDNAAVVATMAPRAVLMINGSEDWLFPTDGVFNIYYRAKKAYRELGVEDRMELAIIEGPHLFEAQHRELGYQWFDRWFKASPIDPNEIWYRNELPDPAPAQRRPLDLDGVQWLCGRYSAAIPDPRPAVRLKLPLPAESQIAIQEVRILVEDTVHFHNKRDCLEPPNVANEYVANIRGQVNLPDYLDLWVARPQGKTWPRLPLTLVLHRSLPPYNAGRDEVMGLAGDASYAIGPKLAQEARLVAAFDLFGHAGRANPINRRRWKDRPERPIVFPALHYINAGTSLLERTVHEIRCVIDYLRSRDDVDGDGVDVVGFGTGAFVGLMAALIEPAIRSVVAVGGVTTQRAAIEAELHDPWFLYQPNLIPAGDVDGALALLAPRPCHLVCFEEDPDWPQSGCEQVVAAMQKAYNDSGRPNAFTVQWLSGRPRMDDSLTTRITAWLGGS